MKKTAMKALILPLLLLSLVLSSIIDISRGEEDTLSSHRRILHQPLFPIDSTPPSPTDPPPSPSNSDIPDQPFLPEVPNGQTADQTQPQQPPPVVPATAETPAQEVPIATQPSKPAKKVAIAISVGIVTLGMLSGLAFFLYRYRVKHQLPTERLGGRSRTETMSSRRGNNNSNEVNEDQMESPYHKLNSLRSSELYRPSPELQPLPPLSRAAAITTSPPVVPFGSSRRGSSAMSSDEETLTSPQLSVKNGENPYMSASRHVFPTNTNTTKSVVTHTTGSSPQSRRSSPKSRFSVPSSPDVKQAIVPSPSSPSLPPLPLPPAQQARDQYDQPRTPSPTKRKAKFRSPPSPPPNLLLPSSINDQQQPRAAKIPVPPPPPPPPPRPPLPPQTVKSVKVKPLEANSTPMSVPVLTMPQSIMTSPKANTCVEVPVPVPVAEETKETSPESVEMVEDEDEAKPKLKPLHWDKVRANSDRAMVWDQMKSSTFQLNEDMIETLFGCNNTNGIQKESTRRSVLPPVELDNRVLDPKKSQNIAILLRALNVTRDEVSEALLDGNPEGLGAELLETLVKMAPTKEEELKLRNYSGDITKLGTAERFLKDILEIPFAFTRVDAMLYRANFDTEVKYLRKSFETLEVACEELKKSRLFLKLLEAVLRTGNRMNVGTNRGDARAFKLDTLLKLVDIKGTDGKTTLLHFVVQEIIRSEGEEDSDPKPEDLLKHIHPKVNEDDFRKQGLQVVAGLSKELGSVKKAAGMDADVLSSYVAKLEVGLKNVRLVLQYDKPDTQGKKFFEAMKLFLNEAEEEILRIKGVEKRALSHVKEVTEYFHGDTTKEGAHPFRIFVIVRDFLSVLDQVCREVGKMHERTMMGVARSFRISANVPLPVLNRFNTRQDKSSDED